MNLKLRQAIVFAILMEGNEGIIKKSPSYVKEKLQAFELKEPEVLLDWINMQKFKDYIEKWENVEIKNG